MWEKGRRNVVWTAMLTASVGEEGAQDSVKFSSSWVPRQKPPYQPDREEREKAKHHQN